MWSDAFLHEGAEPELDPNVETNAENSDSADQGIRTLHNIPVFQCPGCEKGD